MTDPLQALRRQFIERCRLDRARLDASATDSEETSLIVHRLAGAAGAFGFPNLGRTAADLDVRIRNREPWGARDLAPLKHALTQTIEGDRSL